MANVFAILSIISSLLNWQLPAAELQGLDDELGGVG